MPDARALREITDALRVLKDRADAAGWAKARAILTMTAEALHGIAEKAEREVQAPARRPGQVARRTMVIVNAVGAYRDFDPLPQLTPEMQAFAEAEARRLGMLDDAPSF